MNHKIPSNLPPANREVKPFSKLSFRDLAPVLTQRPTTGSLPPEFPDLPDSTNAYFRLIAGYVDCSPTRECFLSQQSITHKLGCSESTFHNHRRRTEEEYPLITSTKRSRPDPECRYSKHGRKQTTNSRTLTLWGRAYLDALDGPSRTWWRHDPRATPAPPDVQLSPSANPATGAAMGQTCTPMNFSSSSELKNYLRKETGSPGSDPADALSPKQQALRDRLVRRLGSAYAWETIDDLFDRLRRANEDDNERFQTFMTRAWQRVNAVRHAPPDDRVRLLRDYRPHARRENGSYREALRRLKVRW